MTKEKVTFRDQSEKILLINTWFRIFLISVIVGTFLYKIIVSPFDISAIDFSAFNFSDFLSLILAIFSIGLSVSFILKLMKPQINFMTIHKNLLKMCQQFLDV